MRKHHARSVGQTQFENEFMKIRRAIEWEWEVCMYVYVCVYVRESDRFPMWVSQRSFRSACRRGTETVANIAWVGGCLSLQLFQRYAQTQANMC